MRKVAIVAAALAVCMMTSATYSAPLRAGAALGEKAAPNKKRVKSAVKQKKSVKIQSRKAKPSSKKKPSPKIYKAKVPEKTNSPVKVSIKSFKAVADYPLGKTSYLRSHFKKSFGVNQTEAEEKEADSAYHPIIDHYATSYGVPLPLAHAVVRVESNYRPDALGTAGEIGLMQIKPATARLMGYIGSDKLLFHPVMNIKYGMRYLAKAHKLGGGSLCNTILKYNAGHSAKRMNPVSAAYCAKVKELV